MRENLIVFFISVLSYENFQIMFLYFIASPGRDVGDRREMRAKICMNGNKKI
jgi:hypothetical protein